MGALACCQSQRAGPEIWQAHGGTFNRAVPRELARSTSTFADASREIPVKLEAAGYRPVTGAGLPMTFTRELRNGDTAVLAVWLREGENGMLGSYDATLRIASGGAFDQAEIDRLGEVVMAICQPYAPAVYPFSED